MNNEKINISAAQVVLLIVGSRLMTAYTSLQILNQPPKNQDVWIDFLLSAVYSVIFCLPVLYLTNKFRGIGLYQIGELILGKIFGRIVIYFYSLVLMFITLRFTVQILIFIDSSVFPETPSWGLMIFIFIPVVYAAYKGIGSISRIAPTIVVFVIFTVFMFALLSYNKMNFGELFPILADSSLKDINTGAVNTGMIFSEIIILPVLSPYIRKNASINRIFGVSLGIFVIIGMFILIPTMTVLGVNIAQHARNPYYLFTRQVETYDFIQRVESFNIIAWFMAILLKQALYTYMISKILSDSFKAKSHKHFVLPVFAIIAIIAILPFINKASTLDLMLEESLHRPISLLVIPIVEIIIYLIRRKTIDKKVNEIRNSQNENAKNEKEMSA